MNMIITIYCLKRNIYPVGCKKQKHSCSGKMHLYIQIFKGWLWGDQEINKCNIKLRNPQSLFLCIMCYICYYVLGCQKRHDIFFYFFYRDIYLCKEQGLINDILPVLFDTFLPSFSELNNSLEYKDLS